MLILPGKTSEETYLRHAKSHPWLDQALKFYAHHPVCPRCESIALRDKGWVPDRIATCPKCGWHGKALTLLETYLKEQYYRR